MITCHLYDEFVTLFDNYLFTAFHSSMQESVESLVPKDGIGTSETTVQRFSMKR